MSIRKHHLSLVVAKKGTPEPAALRRALDRLPMMVADLVATGSAQEVAVARDETEALRYWVKKAKLGMEAQQTAGEARILLEHRLGALLAARLRRGRPKKLRSVDDFTLDEIGATPEPKLTGAADHRHPDPNRAALL